MLWPMLLRPVHTVWHIAGLCWGILFGIAMAPALPAGWFAGMPWLLVGIALAVIALRGHIRLFLLIALLAGLSTGLWRGSGVQYGLLGYSPLYDTQVTVEGTVAEDVQNTGNSTQYITLANIHINGTALPGKIWVSSSQTSLKRSDVAAFSGKLSTGFGNFPAVMYRANLASAHRPRAGDIARDVRDWFATNVRTLIPEPQASLGIGFLTGQRSALPAALDEQLRLVGLTHIVVASGYNLTILVRLARRLFAAISKYMAAVAAFGMIGAFLAITGMSPSMSRAGLIAGLSMAAWYYGRTIHPLVLLPLAAAITALAQPFFVWGDLGWCLSFLAFAGIMLAAPLLKRTLYGHTKPPSLLVSIFIETLSATLLTAPLIALVFGQFSVLAIPANMAIVPLVPIAMFLTFLAGLGSVLLSNLPILGLPATLVLQYMTSAVQWFSNMPFAQIDVTFTMPMLLGTYFLLLCLFVLIWRRTQFSLKETSIIE